MKLFESAPENRIKLATRFVWRSISPKRGAKIVRYRLDVTTNSTLLRTYNTLMLYPLFVLPLFLSDTQTCTTHALSQRDTPERVSLSIMERPRERGRSRHSSSAGRRSDGRGQLQLSSSDVHVMVEQEAESVARELAGEPSLSLLALADARKEMDDIAMKAQVR